MSPVVEKITDISEKVFILLEMIQFKLTVFALPFALTGAFLAARHDSLHPVDDQSM